ncbi:hypothetical protein Bca101_061022 [Brassica carinata]
MIRESSFSLLILTVLIFLLSFDSASSYCQEKCGTVEIPFPFGIGKGCYLNKWYAVTCVNNRSTFLSVAKKEVLHISLPGEYRIQGFDSYGSVYIKNPITSKGCSSNNEKEEAPLDLRRSPFYVSHKNTLIAVGCNMRASLKTSEPGMVGCTSTCGTANDDPSSTPIQNILAYVSCKDKKWKTQSTHCAAGSTGNQTVCNGTGCCQASIPEKLQQLAGVTIDDNTTTGCKVALLTDDPFIFEDISDPKQLHAKGYATVELGWFIHTTGKSFIESLGCVITDELNDTQPSHRRDCRCSFLAGSEDYSSCACNKGYRGNPYVPYGCKDIDECQENKITGGHDLCSPGSTCVNRQGDYTCVPPKTRPIAIGIVIGFVTLISIGGLYWLYKLFKRQRRINRKKKFFKRNGGLLLQQQLISTEGNVEQTKIFSSKELEKATENFSINRVLGQGGQGTVYKGMLVDGRIVAVKKSKVVDEDKLEEFINEVVILSQINHRNIVKLFGCCLETQVPVLVYEFIPNGNLFEHLHDELDDDTMTTWEVRLRIATDVAGALSYLHSAASFPIYHRDIKSTNIMLDEKCQAKVSDFGTSRSVTVDHTHLTTVVSGTVGYVDPEYFQSSQFTDKSDVYSFGVVLVELITGAKAISYMRSEENRALATYFILAMKENRLEEIIDARIKEECKLEQVRVAAKLARKCLNLRGKKRPSMREVSMELEKLRSLHGHPQPQVHITESDEEDEIMEVNIGMESWKNVNVAVTENLATSFLDVEPLFPRQTW